MLCVKRKYKYQGSDGLDGCGVSNELVLQVEYGQNVLDFVVRCTARRRTILCHDDQIIAEPVNGALFA